MLFLMMKQKNKNFEGRFNLPSFFIANHEIKCYNKKKMDIYESGDII